MGEDDMLDLYMEGRLMGEDPIYGSPLDDPMLYPDNVRDYDSDFGDEPFDDEIVEDE
jgi:hypothetical protein